MGKCLPLDPIYGKTSPRKDRRKFLPMTWSKIPPNLKSSHLDIWPKRQHTTSTVIGLVLGLMEEIRPTSWYGKYPHYFDGWFYTSQVVIAGFLNHQHPSSWIQEHMGYVFFFSPGTSTTNQQVNPVRREPQTPTLWGRWQMLSRRWRSGVCSFVDMFNHFHLLNMQSKPLARWWFQIATVRLEVPPRGVAGFNRNVAFSLTPLCFLLRLCHDWSSDFLSPTRNPMVDWSRLSTAMSGWNHQTVRIYSSQDVFHKCSHQWRNRWQRYWRGL